MKRRTQQSWGSKNSQFQLAAGSIVPAHTTESGFQKAWGFKQAECGRFQTF